MNMTRLLVLEVHGVLYPWREAGDVPDSAQWLSMLAALVSPWPDVRLVVATSKQGTPERRYLPLLLGSLMPRVMGDTYGLSRPSAIEAAVRSLPAVESLVLVADDSDLRESPLNVLCCDPQLGISEPRIRTAISAWLARTAPSFDPLGPMLMPSSQSPYIPASPPKSADVVLYLDLDGVVHHEAVLFHPKRGIYMSPSVAAVRTLFEWAPILTYILAPYPEVRLVLSSTWCVRPGYGETLKRLPPVLRQRFIGGTFHKKVHGADPWMRDSFLLTPRGAQVLADAKRRKPRHWIALDDDVEGWPEEALANLIPCDGRTGLSDLQVQRTLRERLFSATSIPPLPNSDGEE